MGHPISSIEQVTEFTLYEGNESKQGDKTPRKPIQMHRGEILNLPTNIESVTFSIAADSDGARAIKTIEGLLTAKGITGIAPKNYDVTTPSDALSGTFAGMMLDAQQASHEAWEGDTFQAPRPGYSRAAANCHFQITLPVKDNEEVIKELARGLNECARDFGRY